MRLKISVAIKRFYLVVKRKTIKSGLERTFF